MILITTVPIYCLYVSEDNSPRERLRYHRIRPNTYRNRRAQYKLLGCHQSLIQSPTTTNRTTITTIMANKRSGEDISKFPFKLMTAKKSFAQSLVLFEKKRANEIFSDQLQSTLRQSKNPPHKTNINTLF